MHIESLPLLDGTHGIHKRAALPEREIPPTMFYPTILFSQLSPTAINHNIQC
jgi:hypothetical protein